MPEDMWKRDNDGQRHLANDILLAYTRGQLAADVVLIVQQHCANCTRCTQRCAEYTNIGATLQHHLAYAMPLYPSVVEMLGTALESQEAAAVALQERKEKRTSGGKQRISASGSRTRRLSPQAGFFPLTVSVMLVLCVFLFVYMLTTHTGMALQPPTGKQAAPTRPLSTVPPQPGVTQTPTRPGTVVSTHTSTTQVVSTPTATTPAVGISKPAIWLCSSSSDLSQSRLRVCGRNFKAGDIVTVLEVLPGIPHKAIFTAIADAHGSITGEWTVQNCRSVPYAIFAFDVTRAWFIQPVVITVPVGNCRSMNVKSWSHR